MRKKTWYLVQVHASGYYKVNNDINVKYFGGRGSVWIFTCLVERETAKSAIMGARVYVREFINAWAAINLYDEQDDRVFFLDWEANPVSWHEMLSLMREGRLSSGSFKQVPDEDGELQEKIVVIDVVPLLNTFSAPTYPSYP